MEGAIDLAEEVFHMPVRLGSPQYISGLVDVVRNPIYATGVGLLLFGNNAGDAVAQHNRFESTGSMWERMRNWFHGNF
jgi:cell division protein FtsA